MSGKRPKREVENAEYLAMVRRILRAMGSRVGDGDLDTLAEMLALREELDERIAETVRSLHGEKWQYSWAQIGRAVGITRQAAQQRWGRDTRQGGRTTGGQPAHLR